MNNKNLKKNIMPQQIINGVGKAGFRTTSSGGGSSFDTDAQAFITATAITDTTQKNAINDLVLDLKAAGVWTKMKALYPMVGGTATTHKFNLKDPRDLDAAYRLTFAGGWTHSSTGALPNGTTGYANTNLSQNPVLNQNSWAMSIYLRTNLQANTVFGVSQTGVQTALYPYQATNTWAFDDFNSTGTLISEAVSNSLGFYQGVRQTSSVVKMIKNTAIASKTSNSSGRNTIPFYLGGVNFNSTAVGFSARQIAFSSIGDGLTDLESNLFYQIVEKYQYALGRNVNANQTFYFNRNYSNETNAFIFNGAITDATQISAVNTLVTTLKTAGIWTKMKAVYPMVGGTATSHKFNLVNPIDSTSAYALTFNGGWTHSSTGALPNGSTGYANTFLKPFGTLDPNSLHMSYYGRTDILTAKQLMGSALSYPLMIGHSYWGVTGNVTFNSDAAQNGVTLSVQTQNKPSLIMLNRQNSTLFKFVKRGVVLGSNTSANVISLPNTTGGGSPGYIYLGSTFRAVTAEMTYSNLECAFASIGDGLTDAEATTFYNAVQAFQTTLGRQV